MNRPSHHPRATRNGQPAYLDFTGRRLAAKTNREWMEERHRARDRVGLLARIFRRDRGAEPAE